MKTFRLPLRLLVETRRKVIEEGLDQANHVVEVMMSVKGERSQHRQQDRPAGILDVPSSTSFTCTAFTGVSSAIVDAVTVSDAIRRCDATRDA